MDYMNVKRDDILASGVVSETELEWAENLRIPYPGSGAMWAKLHGINGRIAESLKSGILKEIEREQIVPQKSVQIISDYIAGPMSAIQNQADGKIYDSKSQYYKAVKAAGCVVMGNDAPKEGKGPTANICEKELKRDIAQAINQLGG